MAKLLVMQQDQDCLGCLSYMVVIPPYIDAETITHGKERLIGKTLELRVLTNDA
jgi:hypothetical protein